MRAATGTLTVNAAFLQEIKDVNLDLWRLLDELRSMASTPLGDSQRRYAFVLSLEELRDQLALHFALEEAYGYFEDPVYVAPRLCEEAHALRAEHRKLYVQACDITERAMQFLESRTEITRFQQVAEEFLEFDEQLRLHERAENDLILREYDDDLGVGD